MEKEAALLESGKENEDLCSFYEDELTELYSSCGSDTCRVRGNATKEISRRTQCGWRCGKCTFRKIEGRDIYILYKMALWRQ